MENKVVRRFIEKVNELLPDADRPTVFEALKRYQSSMELRRLVDDLKAVLDEPNKLEIFEYIRPLIPPKHQVDYDKLAPAPPGRKLRSITLRRHSNESFGFAVRGGFEHGIGIFVSQVDPGSQAEAKGLKIGDEIVRVNGFTIAEAIHDEVLNLIKGRQEIELKVTNIGMLPIKERATDPVTWSYVDKNSDRNVRKSQEMGPAHKRVAADEVKLFVNLRSAPSLGCSILSGPRHFPGIFVERVNPESLGEEIGIEVGDQFIDVNGTSFLDITHREAVVALKSSKELNIVIRKRTGLPLVQKSGNSETPSQAVSADSTINHPAEVHAPPPTSPQGNQSITFIDYIDKEFPKDPNYEVDREEDLIAAELRRQESRRRRSVTGHDDLNYTKSTQGCENQEHDNRDTYYVLHDVLSDTIVEGSNGEVKEEDKDDENGTVNEEDKRKREEQEEEEEEGTERLKRVVQEKLERQRKEAEDLRQEMFEANKRKRQLLESELLRKVSLHHKEGEKEHLLRLQRQHQDREEMLREGAMSGLVHSIIHMWRPHSVSTQETSKSKKEMTAEGLHSTKKTDKSVRTVHVTNDLSSYNEDISKQRNGQGGPTKAFPLPEEQITYF